MNVIAQAQFKTAHRRYEMTEAERKIRVEAAAAFRLAHHYRWNLQINNHICVRIPDRPDHFLMNPYGLGWDEITASNLATVRKGGEIVSHDGVTLGPAGLNFHSGILRARPRHQLHHACARPPRRRGLGDQAGPDHRRPVEHASLRRGRHPRLRRLRRRRGRGAAHPARPRRQALPDHVEPRPAHHRPHHRARRSSTCAAWSTPASCRSS